MEAGRALLSLHDVTPAFETEIRQALSQLRQWRLPTPALMVVPDYHGRWPLDGHPAFCDFLRGVGGEIVLHGYDHLAVARPEGIGERLKAAVLTSGEAEFQALPFGRAMERIGRGISLVERMVGSRPRGFVAPAWLEHRDTYRALDAAGLAFHEDHLFVRDLGTLERTLAPAIAFTSRNLLRTWASVAWARSVERVARGRRDLRLALHPGDLVFEPLVSAIGRLVEAVGDGRDWISYGEFLGLDG